MSKKLYVASSWRNSYQPAVVSIARGMGFSVYDFREPEPGVKGFGWKAIEPSPVKEWTFERYREVLAHPIAEDAFQRDLKGLQADATLLVMPAGRSAHWEHGYAVGRGQQVATLYPVDIGLSSVDGHEPNMSTCGKCFHKLCTLRTKLRSDFEPELMVKGGSGGILIGRRDLDFWLSMVLHDVGVR